MFSSRKHPKLEVIVGNDTVIKGEIVSKGAVRIDGRLEGSIAAESVIVGQDANILGDITSKTLIAAGRVTGDTVRAIGLDGTDFPKVISSHGLYRSERRFPS